jgi:hypothetical protein
LSCAPGAAAALILTEVRLATTEKREAMISLAVDWTAGPLVPDDCRKMKESR